MSERKGERERCRKEKKGEDGEMRHGKRVEEQHE